MTFQFVVFQAFILWSRRLKCRKLPFFLSTSPYLANLARKLPINVRFFFSMLDLSCLMFLLSWGVLWFPLVVPLSSQNPKHSCAGQQYLWSNAVPTAQVRPCDGALVLGFASIPFSRKLCWDMLGIVGRFVGILETLRLIQIAYVFHDVPIRSMWNDHGLWWTCRQRTAAGDRGAKEQAHPSDGGLDGWQRGKEVQLNVSMCLPGAGSFVSWVVLIEFHQHISAHISTTWYHYGIKWHRISSSCGIAPGAKTKWWLASPNTWNTLHGMAIWLRSWDGIGDTIDQ